jgi:hypothetical protein
MIKSKKLQKRRTSPYLVIFVLAFVSVLLFNLMSAVPTAKQIVPVKAEYYIWPEGCEQKRYSYSDEISSKCMDSRYVLSNEFAENLGARTRTRRSKWDSYRVGNDIIGIYKSKRETFFKVKTIKRNVFYQEKQNGL